jgi:hypothetical protein
MAGGTEHPEGRVNCAGSIDPAQAFTAVESAKSAGLADSHAGIVFVTFATRI